VAARLRRGGGDRGGRPFLERLSDSRAAIAKWLGCLPRDVDELSDEDYLAVVRLMRREAAEVEKIGRR
jgi:hypothetical protein